MHLWGRNGRPSVPCNAAQQQMVRDMTYRMNAALIASVSAIALILAANESFGGTGTAHVGGSASRHSTFHKSALRSLRHHRRIDAEAFWPATGDFYEPSTGEPAVDGTHPTKGDIHYSYTHDVPWDWAHRYPPAVTPSERAYVPECPAQTVTVLGANGREQTVNIVRCY
jgi:hypothetical protein